jgi:hypothetical protein
MANAHSCQREIIRTFIQKDVLDHWQTIRAVAWKQNPTIQNNTTTYMDIRNPPLGNSLTTQHWYLTPLSKQSVTNDSDCAMLHTQQRTTRRSAHTNRSGRSYEAQHRPQGQTTPTSKSTNTHPTRKTRTEKTQTLLPIWPDTQILIKQTSHGSGIKWRVLAGTRLIKSGLYGQSVLTIFIHILVVPYMYW